MSKKNLLITIARYGLWPVVTILALVRCADDSVTAPSGESPFAANLDKTVNIFTTGDLPDPVRIQFSNNSKVTESAVLVLNESSASITPSSIRVAPGVTQNCTLAFDSSLVFFGVTEYIVSVKQNGVIVDELEIDLLKKRTAKYEGSMVFVKAADVGFFMGDSTVSSAGPRHSTRISYNFYMDTVEVNQKMYSQLMDGAKPSSVIDAVLPVHNVTWYDAIMYCNARSKVDGLDTVFTYSSVVGSPGNGCSLQGIDFDIEKNGYRLPTEAEWEFACRSRENSVYYWGIRAEPEYAWYEVNASAPRPGAEKVENVFGLYDMSGNVAEWCLDWYGRYSPCQQLDPIGCTDSWCSYDNVAPDEHCGSKRVFRGGSFDDFGRNVTSVVRFSLEPNRGLSTLGFRCVRRAMDRAEEGE